MPSSVVKPLGVILEVPDRVFVRPRSAAHQVRTGIGGRLVGARAVEIVELRRERLVDPVRRVALVASAPDGDAGMVAVALDRVGGVRQPAFGVGGREVVAVGGNPEIVPDEDAVLVRQRVEALLRLLTHPVAHHRHVRVAVQPEVRFQPFHGRGTFQRVVEAPVAAQDEDALAVDLDDQRRLLGGRVAGGQVFVGHLTQADALRQPVGLPARGVQQAQGKVVQRRFAVAVGPPEPGIAHRQRGHVGRIGGHDFRFAGCQHGGQAEFHVAQRAFEGDALLSGGEVARLGLHGHLGHGEIGRFGQRGDHARVPERDRPGGAQDDILPDARVAVADGGNPVPALRWERSSARPSCLRLRSPPPRP